jgi:hypothetical protein
VDDDSSKSTSKNPDLRASASRLACLNHFIPTAALLKKSPAYISTICGAAKFFRALHLGEL